MKFPKLASNELITSPFGHTAKDLFFACVKYLASQQVDFDYKTHNQWASSLFRKEKFIDAESKMSKIILEYGNYFIKQKNGKYTFDVEKIVSHFPQLFYKDVIIKTKEPLVQLFTEIQQALTNELDEIKSHKDLQKYKLEKLEKVSDKLSIYDCEVITENEGIPHFREGLSFKISIDGKLADCEVIEYDPIKEHLYFTSPMELREKGKMYAILDTSFIIEALKKRIVALTQNEIGHTLPIYKFLVNKTEDITTIPHKTVAEHIYSNLNNDTSQLNAFNAAIDHDITFVWGPPGTGKSYALATIIRALYEFENERTVVCCVSNVAVDELTKKVIKIIDDEHLAVEPGNFYRAGHSTDEKILATDYLFPNDEETIRLRNEIERKQKSLERLMEISKYSDRGKAIEIKAEIKDLRVQLKKHTEFLVGKSRVVYSTIANFIVNDSINKSNFDNLIVDESSMLALPQLLALAKNVIKRIILVGDFQQLSPISLTPGKCLRDNVFKIAGIDINHTTHKALHLLMNQRRSHEKIVNIINKPFYASKLHATICETNGYIVDVGPFSGRVVTTIPVADSAYRYTKGGTRQNKKSAEYIMSLVQQYHDEASTDFSIGIITPYKGQVSLLKALLQEKDYEQVFLDRIKIGTVHTFQGSECDIIIYDIVDCDKSEDKKVSAGQIYWGEEGEQLLNVALSRARQKLIVVGDAAYFESAKGAKLSNKTLKIFNILSNFQVNNAAEDIT